MKLLLDQHISFRLLRLLDAEFPGSRHVKDFNLTEVDDEVIWQFAIENDFVIVSKDLDFFHRSAVRGYPPKVLYLRVGNCPSNKILDLLLSNRATILNFVSDSVESLLILQ